MKLDTTEKEAMDGFFKSWLGGREEGMRFFRCIMGAFGVEFREERLKEPELPERIHHGGDSFGLWVMDANAEPRSLTEAEGREAAACHNAMGRLLRGLEDGSAITERGKREDRIMLAVVRLLLAEERERLQ